MEFYERKRSRWLLPAETSNWEVWSLGVTIVQPRSDLEWEEHQSRLVEALTDAVSRSCDITIIYVLYQVMYITEVVNSSEYVPRNPAQDSVATVFDTTLPTIQPYLHKVHTYNDHMSVTIVMCLYQVTFEVGGDSVAGSVRKFIRDTFAYNY